MINQTNDLSNKRINKFYWTNIEFSWISVYIFAINIALMCFVSFYWLDTEFHTLISGKPFN